MTPRPLLLALPLLALAACGDDSPAADTQETSPPTTPAPTAPAPGQEYEYATGAEDVVINVEYEGGFVPQQMIFSRTPVAMITGDGYALSTGPVIAIFPGPLLPNVLQRTITPAATQDLLSLADELGLLQEVEYARNDLIADAADTVVTITVDGTVYRHQAYALDIEPESDSARANLAEFVAAVTDLPGTVGDQELGSEEPYAAETYLIRATPVVPEELSVDVEPTIEEWPADASVRLVAATDCAEVPVAEYEPLFRDATQLTLFVDEGETYQLAVVPQVPGRTC